MNEYTGTPESNGEFIINNMVPYDKELVLGVLSPEEGERGINGAKQITVAVQSSVANNIKLFKLGLDGEYAELKTNIQHSTALINGEEYSVLAYLPRKTFSTEIYKVLLTNE